MLAEPDALPRAQVQLAVGHGHRQVGAEEAGLHVCRLKKKEENYYTYRYYYVYTAYARMARLLGTLYALMETANWATRSDHDKNTMHIYTMPKERGGAMAPQTSAPKL